ncbi:MAG TPA: dihydrofolate reductase family protein [Puia sp.]|nr:dihydrofolate reductase family protein [Puia sp.]
MRNLVYAINLSVDGCCDHAMLGPECITDDVAEYYMDIMRDVDLTIFGRKTYELMIPYWPDVAKDPTATKSDIEFAQKFTAMDKIVVSRSLANAEANTRIVRTNPGDELLRLKQKTGKKISVGGVDLPQQFIALGLVDEFYFFILPIIVGEGRRLLEGTGLPAKQQLKLVGSKIFRSGAVALHYLKQS